ncbi:MAG: peptidase U32 family protein [Catenisphaera adipataccumulans]|jgi:putative protease|uniref:peptidase U32 family protein n=1 Tax=Catenisphaera adipataccumulans TaxID=700500 RepID=UPI003D923589
MILTTIHSIDRLNDLKKAGADAVIIGVQDLSIRSLQYAPFEQIPKWKQACDSAGLKLYINALKLCMDEDLENVRKLLEICQEQEIDGVYFADEGILYEAKQRQLEHLLIYQPETLITNHLDVQFYLKQGIQAVSLAHELSLDEIGKMAVPGAEVLLSGYYSLLYSRRPLVSNYFDFMHKDVDVNGRRFDLIEQTRTDRMPIVQDETGTHIFSEVPIASFQEFEQLKQMGIQRFRIDSMFFDDGWTVQTLKAYTQHGRPTAGSDQWYYQKSGKTKEDVS